MQLRTSWRNVAAWWDHLFACCDFGFVHELRRRKPAPRKPMFRRPDLTFDQLEKREVPAALTGITEYSITTANSDPKGITAGPDGNTWFVEYSGNKVAKITPSGTITEYSLPTGSTGPYDIVTGSDNNLWVTAESSNEILKVTTSGSFTSYSITTAGSLPHGITAGPDGNLWFTERNAGKIAKITTSGSITEYTIPNMMNGPEDIASGPDGNLWYTNQSEPGAKIGKITTGGTITEYNVPTALGPFGIAADNSIWFTASSANKIGRLTVTGSFTEYTIPTANSSPHGITIGPDANVWFVESATDKIGRVNAFGEFTEFTVPTTSASLEGITVGADGNLWVTAPGTNKIIKYAGIQQTHVPTNDPSQCHTGVVGLAAAPATAGAGQFGVSLNTGTLAFKLPPLDGRAISASYDPGSGANSGAGSLGSVAPPQIPTSIGSMEGG